MTVGSFMTADQCDRKETGETRNSTASRKLHQSQPSQVSTEKVWKGGKPKPPDVKPAEMSSLPQLLAMFHLHHFRCVNSNTFHGKTYLLKKRLMLFLKNKYLEESNSPELTGACTSEDSDHEMGNSGRMVDRPSSSSSRERNSSRDLEGIEKVSDAIYKFYEPESTRSASVDIFFFHGLECELQDANVRESYVSAWKTGEQNEVWPQKWLPEDFPGARIFSVCYDNCMKQTDTKGRMDLYLIAENLLQEITWAWKEHHAPSPVILVGHGFGGIVMKSLCVRAENQKGKSGSDYDMCRFLESIRGCFFYATPHLGTHGFDSAAETKWMRMVKGFDPPAEKQGPLVKWMRMLNAESARLNQDFLNVWRPRSNRWAIFELGESEEFGVPEASSRFIGVNYMTISGDHFSVCRPCDKVSNNYIHLKHLIEKVERQAKFEKRLPLMVPEVVVGVEALVTDIVEKHLRHHTFVGLCGMGGVGKTTLAKLIFNQVHAAYEFTCFVEGINQFHGKMTKEEVKGLAWRKMRRHGGPVHSVRGSGEGDEWYEVAGKSLFIVFDDVEDPNHVTLLKEIVYENGKEDSRFILTSRNAQRLKDCGSNLHSVHVDILGSEDAKKLFTTYAFPEEEPPEVFREVVGQIVKGCEGLPVTLEVLGRYLKGRKLQYWSEIPSALRDCDEIADLQEKVWAKLQLSYDGLPGNEVKNMFLDVASVFLYTSVSVDEAISAWSCIYGKVQNRLQLLEDRALVTVRDEKDDDGETCTRFYMHEHLSRMGRKIGRQEGRWTMSFGTSLVNLNIVDDIFQQDQELGKLVAHNLQISPQTMRISGQSCALCMTREVWPKLTAIRYMELQIPCRGCCERCMSQVVALPNTLVMFRCTAIGGNIVLSAEAGGNYVDNVTGTLSLSRCASLVKLELRYCNIVDLGGLNELRHLQTLLIEFCEAVRWPRFLRGLKNLERLQLEAIREPFDLPISIGELTSLRYLRIETCNVSSLPSSFQNLTNLQSLLVEIADGQSIPGIIESFQQLQVLEISCEEIPDLKDAFRNLAALRVLTLNYDRTLQLPDTLGNLTSLEELLLVGPIQRLPASFSNLTQLEKAEFNGDFGGLSCGSGLCAAEIRSHQVFADVFQLQGFSSKITKLLIKCEHAALAIVVSNMVNLEILDIRVKGHQAVSDIFGDLQRLRSLRLLCFAVENNQLESLRRLSSLEELDVICQTLERLPVVLGCFTLKSLGLDCPSLQAFPEMIWQLPYLQSLNLWGLQKLETFPEALGDLRSLHELEFRNSAVESLPESLGRLSDLRKLRVISCKNLQTLPDTIGDLFSLTSLDLINNSALHSLPGTFSNLSQLRFLTIQGCTDLKLPSDILTSFPNLHVRYDFEPNVLIGVCSSISSYGSDDDNDSEEDVSLEELWYFSRLSRHVSLEELWYFSRLSRH